MDTCKIEECVKPTEARGWCRMHYGRWYRWGDPQEPDRRKNKPKAKCSIDGCDNDHSAKGLCKNHYEVQRRDAGGTYKCNQCGVMFEAQKKRSGHTFCSRTCKQGWHNAQPEHKALVLERYYVRRYGMTKTEADALKAGGCDICGRTEVSGRWDNNMHIDHDHETGKVRGVLCHGCNVGLGHFDDDPALLQRAVDYLGT